MSRYARLLLPVLLLALALALASCGGSSGVQGSSGEGETDAQARGAETTGGMAGMDRGPTGMRLRRRLYA